MPFDFEIGVHCRDRSTNSYDIDVRFVDGTGEMERREVQCSPSLSPNEREHLRQLELSASPEYGRELTRILFPPRIAACFQQSLDAVSRANLDGQGGNSLRVRLYIGPSAPELHSWRWETMFDPRSLDGDSLFWLCGQDNVLFSRYIPSFDARPLPRRNPNGLQALVLVANPRNLDLQRPADHEEPLSPVQVLEEVGWAQAHLRGIETTLLASGDVTGSKGAPTLDNLITHIKAGPGNNYGFDIIYLVCHGALPRASPYLYLEDAGGDVERVAGEELVKALRGGNYQPRLIVLCSCQSAGNGNMQSIKWSSTDNGALSALGPQLASIGIPAILAMQGNVLQPTAHQFLKEFFAQLTPQQTIDTAVTRARYAVRNQSDRWSPVLYTHLLDGKLWPDATNAVARADSFSQWQSLVRDLANGDCTPILGPGLIEPLLGSTRDVARRWAEGQRYPLSANHYEDLPQIAQYLSISKRRSWINEEVLRDYNRQLERLFPDEPHLNNRLTQEAKYKHLADRITCAGHLLRDEVTWEPHRILAKMSNCPLYITTNQDSLLVDALRTVGREPQLEHYRWTSRVQKWPPSFFDYDENNMVPVWKENAKTPLVYRLFGSFEPALLSAIALTEDDYFDFMDAFNRADSKKRFPDYVLQRLSNSGLLFLGFDLNDWSFRVLFRIINQLGGSTLRNDFTNVAVQIDPATQRNIDPLGALNYLQRYCGDKKIELFLGNIEDFMSKLRKQWQQEYDEIL